MIRLFVLILLLGLSTFSEVAAQQLKIGIWCDGQPTQRFYFHSDEEVVWSVNGDKKITIEAGRTSYFTSEGSSIKLSTADKTYGRFKNIKLFSSSEDFVLKGLIPERREEKYDQVIEISIANNGMKIINWISDLDAYVAGVVESESGKEQVFEFYKVQAVISRTYALSNRRKHEEEDFNLCDQVHCQVYHGKARFNPEAIRAARETEGQVLVDSEIELITAAFHSNCGGHTVNSEHVWSKALPYLVAREDSFCLNGNHATWEAEIPKSAWHEHLIDESPTLAKKHSAALYSFRPEKRQISYPSANGFELKNLRYQWNLNSTFFTIEDSGENLSISGRGFGHGVGLCQEGAMGMIARGYPYQEVLEFYYTDVHLVHLSAIDFFRED